MQTDRTRFVPGVVRDLAAELHSDTGVEPEIDQMKPGAWRITMRNDRVLMTVDYKRKSSRSVKWAASKLWVDGQPRHLCRDPQEFIRLFNDPDSGGRKSWTPDPTPPERPVDEAPPAVQEMHAKLARGGHENAKVAYDDEGTWVVSLISGRLDLRVFYVDTAAGWRMPLNRPPVILKVEGEDRTGLLVHGIEDALRIIADESLAENAVAAPAIPRAQGAARSSSVEVRRATVIRR